MNLQLFMLSGQIIKIIASMLKFALQIFDFTFKFSYSSLKKFFLRLSKFGFFLLGQNQFLHLFVKNLLNISNPLFMLDLVLVEHLLVHQHLLGEGRFNPITLLNQLAESIFEQTIEGLRLAHLAALFLYFLQGSHFSEKHIVS